VSPAPTSPPALLSAALRRDGSRPLVTSYDEGTGERVELSVATFDNWVAKTAGLLRDGLEVDAGTRVTLLLPAHWQALVWASACWAAGCCAVLGDAADVGVVVTGPAAIERAPGIGAEHVVALSLLPWGVPFREPLPTGVLDYALEAPAQPDHFVPYGPAEPAEPAVDAGGTVHTQGGLVELALDRASSSGLADGVRLLRRADDLDLGVLLDLLLVPLVTGGSAVLVRGPADGSRVSRLAETERVDRVL
jgi:uncharacterized protein (TIGR03089 family)